MATEESTWQTEPTEEELEEIELDMGEMEKENSLSDDLVKDYLKSLEQRCRLTSEEELRLFSEYQKNRSIKLRDQLVEANLRLVVFYAKKYQNQGLDFMDLIQEGNMGLLVAIDRYDPSLGYKFSTYASWWIRQSLTKGLYRQGNPIRFPAQMTEMIRKFGAVKGSFLSQEEILELSKKTGVPAKRIQDYQKLDCNVISLELPIGEDGNTILSELIPDETLISPQQQVEQNEFLQVLMSAFLACRLTNKEITVLLLCSGVLDDYCRNFAEVGRLLHITRERVRQIHTKALSKMRENKELENHYRKTGDLSSSKKTLPVAIVQERMDSLSTQISTLLSQSSTTVTEDSVFAHKPLQKK